MPNLFPENYRPAAQCGNYEFDSLGDPGDERATSFTAGSPAAPSLDCLKTPNRVLCNGAFAAVSLCRRHSVSAVARRDSHQRL
jgi:hypothetical protein